MFPLQLSAVQAQAPAERISISSLPDLQSPSDRAVLAASPRSLSAPGRTLSRWGQDVWRCSCYGDGQTSLHCHQPLQCCCTAEPLISAWIAKGKNQSPHPAPEGISPGFMKVERGPPCGRGRFGGLWLKAGQSLGVVPASCCASPSSQGGAAGSCLAEALLQWCHTSVPRSPPSAALCSALLSLPLLLSDCAVGRHMAGTWLLASTLCCLRSNLGALEVVLGQQWLGSLSLPGLWQ